MDDGVDKQPDSNNEDGWLQSQIRRRPLSVFFFGLLLFISGAVFFVLSFINNDDGPITVPVVSSVCPALTLSRDLGSLVAPLVSPDNAHIVRVELDTRGFPVFHLTVFDPVLGNYTERLPSISSAAFIPTSNPAGLRPSLHFAVNDTELIFALVATQVLNGQGVIQFFRIRFNAWAQTSANSARNVNIVSRKVPDLGGFAFDPVAGVWCCITSSNNAAEVSIQSLSADLGGRTLIASAAGLLTSTEARSLHLITSDAMVVSALSPSDSAISFLYQFKREANNVWVPTDESVIVPNNFFVTQVNVSSDGNSLFSSEIGADNQRGQVRVFGLDAVSRLFRMSTSQILAPSGSTTNFGSSVASVDDIVFVQSTVNSGLQMQIFQRNASGSYVISSTSITSADIPFASPPNNLLSGAGVVSIDGKSTFVGSNGSLSGPVSYRLSCGS